MENVILDFEDKVKELDLYLKFVKSIDEQHVQVHSPNKRTYEPIDNDILPILKANSFLIIYNLVESSVRDGVLAIYKKMEVSSCSYTDVNDKIKKIWSRYEFKKSFDINSSWETYYSKTLKLAHAVLNEEILKMDRNAIPVSGNLDADQVRVICDLHGIKKTVHTSANGGVKLSDVKEQRNFLAHGTLGFSECGRQYSLESINEIKVETIHFVRSILKNMKEYIDSEKFLK